VHHALLVERLVELDLVSTLLEPLTNAREVPVSEDTERSGNQPLFLPVPFAVLVLEKFR